jgi:hypothetical protein
MFYWSVYLTKTYIYLARRDKKGILLLGTTANCNVLPVKITDIKQLGIPHNLIEEFQRLVYDNRMLYELWIESAKDYQNLKDNLRKRGFSNLSLTEHPITRNLLNLNINTNNLPQQKIMMQKNQ